MIFSILPHRPRIPTSIFSNIYHLSHLTRLLYLTIIFFSKFEIGPLSILILTPNYHFKKLSSFFFFFWYASSDLLTFWLPSETLDFCMYFVVCLLTWCWGYIFFLSSREKHCFSLTFSVVILSGEPSRDHDSEGVLTLKHTAPRNLDLITLVCLLSPFIIAVITALRLSPQVGRASELSFMDEMISSLT